MSKTTGMTNCTYSDTDISKPLRWVTNGMWKSVRIFFFFFFSSHSLIKPPFELRLGSTKVKPRLPMGVIFFLTIISSGNLSSPGPGKVASIILQCLHGGINTRTSTVISACWKPGLEWLTMAMMGLLDLVSMRIWWCEAYGISYWWIVQAFLMMLTLLSCILIVLVKIGIMWVVGWLWGVQWFAFLERKGSNCGE